MRDINNVSHLYFNKYIEDNGKLSKILQKKDRLIKRIRFYFLVCTKILLDMHCRFSPAVLDSKKFPRVRIQN